MLNAAVKNFQFTSDFDGLEIDASIAVPSSNINGIVQIVHGMCEYKERYFPLWTILPKKALLPLSTITEVMEKKRMLQRRLRLFIQKW